MSSAAARRASSGVGSAATAASSSSARTSVRFGRRTEDSDDGYSLTLGDALSRGVFQVATTTPDDGGDERPVHWQRLGSTGTAGTAGSMMEVPLGEGGPSLREMLGGEESPPGSEASRRDPDDTYDLSGEVAPGNLCGSFHSMASSVRSSFLSSDGARDGDGGEEESMASGGSVGSRGSCASAGRGRPASAASGRRWRRFATALAAATLLGCTAYFASEAGLLEGAALRSVLGRRRGLLPDDDPGRLLRKAAREERRRAARDERLERMLERERETAEAIERAARSEEWRTMIREGHDGGGTMIREGRRLGDGQPAAIEEDWHRHLARREAVDWALEPERQRLLVSDGRAVDEWDRYVAQREAIDRALEPEGQRLLMMRGG